jgi:hypothetical protein
MDFEKACKSDPRFGKLERPLFGNYLCYPDRLSVGSYLSPWHEHMISQAIIYESSLRAGHGWRESLYRHRGCLRLLIVGSGCWSPLERAPRGEKLPKRLPNGRGTAEAKAAALHLERY